MYVIFGLILLHGSNTPFSGHICTVLTSHRPRKSKNAVSPCLSWIAPKLPKISSFLLKTSLYVWNFRQLRLWLPNFTITVIEIAMMVKNFRVRLRRVILLYSFYKYTNAKIRFIMRINCLKFEKSLSNCLKQIFAFSPFLVWICPVVLPRFHHYAIFILLIYIAFSLVL